MFSTKGVLIIYLIAVTIFLSSLSFAQENIGFEKGNFDNWDFAIGKLEADGSVTAYNAFADPNSFKMLMKDQSGLKDDYGGFSIFSPNGGKYSVKLGNTLYGNRAQQMSYKLKVPQTGSSSIIFNYAVVLVSPGHEPNQQPRFTVKIYNVTDDKYLACPSFDFISSANLPGFKLVSDSVFVKPWSSATINLTGLNNKEIRIEFTVNHCFFGQHFGYAYIDVNENIGAAIEGNNYCTNQPAITLSAPPGFASYSWSTADFKTPIGTGQYLSIPPPPDQTKLAVLVTPFNGLGCADTLYTTVHDINAEFKFVAKGTIAGCPGTAIDLTKASVTAGSSPGLKFDYLTDAFEYLPSPDHITQAGLYYIRATNPGGCSNLLPVTITFGLPELAISNPAVVTFPATVDLSRSFTPQASVTYGYYTNEAATIPVSDYVSVQTSGTYFIKAESAEGCVNIQPVVVTVQPPAPFTITAPNTFTPNGDGINDYFATTSTGYVLFNGLSIYNRNGTLIFHTTNKTQTWDGRIKGQQASTGTYYWVFEGYDNYHHKKISESSFITLIR